MYFDKKLPSNARDAYPPLHVPSVTSYSTILPDRAPHARTRVQGNTAVFQRRDDCQALETILHGDGLRMLQQLGPQAGMLGGSILLGPTARDCPNTCTSRMMAAPVQISQSGRRGCFARQRRRRKPASWSSGVTNERKCSSAPPARIYQVFQLQSFRLHSLFSHFTAANALAGGAPALQLLLHIQAQAGAFVTLHHIHRGDIAHHPVHPAVARDGRLDIGDQPDQLCGGIRDVFAPLPVGIQLSCSPAAGSGRS